MTERDIESSSVLWSVDEVILPHTDDTSLWEEEEKGGCGFTWPLPLISYTLSCDCLQQYVTRFKVRWRKKPRQRMIRMTTKVASVSGKNILRCRYIYYVCVHNCCPISVSFPPPPGAHGYCSRQLGRASVWSSSPELASNGEDPAILA